MVKYDVVQLKTLSMQNGKVLLQSGLAQKGVIIER